MLCRYIIDFFHAITYHGNVRKPPGRLGPPERRSHTSRRRTDVTITVSTTNKRDGKALALFARCSEWQQGRTHDGRSFFAIPGSVPGLYHIADQNGCSCPDRQRSRNVCK